MPVVLLLCVPLVVLHCWSVVQWFTFSVGLCLVLAAKSRSFGVVVQSCLLLPDLVFMRT